MRTISLESEGLTLERLLQEAEKGEVVFLTRSGQTQFALVPADEADKEVCALRSNPGFMTYLAACEERAKTQPRKSFREIREVYGNAPEGPGSPGGSS
jgi:antitoxin (DNA-binding transcriptional repressor) of toxin-antitoxin stability system